MKLKKLLVALGLAGLLAGCSGDTGEDHTDISTEVAPDTSQEEEKQNALGVNVKVYDEEAQLAIDPGLLETLSKQEREKVLASMFKNYFTDAEFDEELKMFKITPNEALAEIVAGLKVHNQESVKESWDGLVGSAVSLSEGVRKAIESGYTIALVNPVNENNILLLVSDGMVLYDEVNGDGLFQAVEWEKVDELVTNG